jgi:hypothetical protein
MLRATDFIILRKVVSDPRINLSVEREPIAVATLMNEKRFIETKGALIQRDTIFIEDKIHDWNWIDGKFRYFSRVVGVSDIVLIYAQEDGPAICNFCPYCGVKQGPNSMQCHVCDTHFT